MQKIITQKSIDDYQNERILLRFQREAEEFKKSKSKHMKHLRNIMVSEKDLAESRQASPSKERSEADFDHNPMFFQSEEAKLVTQRNKTVNVANMKTLDT